MTTMTIMSTLTTMIELESCISEICYKKETDLTSEAFHASILFCETVNIEYVAKRIDTVLFAANRIRGRSNKQNDNFFLAFK